MSGLSHHPAPGRATLPPLAVAFVLYTGPLAWFAQFCASFVLADWPCFPKTIRHDAPAPGFGWTSFAQPIVTLLALAAMAVACMVAMRACKATRPDGGEDHHDLIDPGGERTRFIAFWGICLNLGFAIATLLDLAAVAMVPRCAG